MSFDEKDTKVVTGAFFREFVRDLLGELDLEPQEISWFLKIAQTPLGQQIASEELQAAELRIQDAQKYLRKAESAD